LKIEKSKGLTPTEKMLADFCERSFLKLWSYPNPYKDDGKELCDVLVVFENESLIFFDRRTDFPATSDKDPRVLWQRWRRKAIDRQIGTVHGAADYVRSGRAIYLDPQGKTPFPISIDLAKVNIHKIIVAHGAAEACLSASETNVSGSLAISYSTQPENDEVPFMLDLDKNDPVHVFDSHSLPILLNELDTIGGFTNYLDAKEDAIRGLDFLSYCGEEDLLAHYLLNLDENGRHVIGVKDKSVNGVAIGEGEWKDFTAMPLYVSTKTANKASYLWDEIIQRTSQNSLDGTLLGSGRFGKRSAIIEMAKEPRFMRRELSQAMINSIRAYPKHLGASSRNVSLWPSFDAKKAYVFLQVRPPEEVRRMLDYRGRRQRMLEIACAAAKNIKPDLEVIVGIAIDAPEFADEDGEDFLLLDCKEWPEERKLDYQSLNAHFNFFQSPSLQKKETRVFEFVEPQASDAIQAGNGGAFLRGLGALSKVGRNKPCPCGSGRKYKHCHYGRH